MKTDFYLKFADEAEALAALSQIDAKLSDSDKWAEPIVHPFEASRLIPWNLEYLRSCAEFLENRKRLSVDQATKAGYDIGFHRGKFSQASRKIEEARFILEMIPAVLAVPNFPACRALFYGFQSSIYSTREAIKESCNLLGGPGKRWWVTTEKRIKKEDPFIQFLHIDYNRDKHGEAGGVLVPSLKLYEFKGARADFISGEGVFQIENKGTDRERRVFLPGPSGEMSLRIEYDNKVVRGKDVSSLPFVEQMSEIVAYYEELIREAKTKFG